MTEEIHRHADLPESPLAVRAAVRIGHVWGTWRRRRLAARQDAYVDAWKAAWLRGCHARWAGQGLETVPHRSGAAHDAWIAGWMWADHPDHPVRPQVDSTDVRLRTASPAPGAWRTVKRGALGLTLVAAARWWWRSDGSK